MSKTVAKFNRADRPEFFKVLNQRVNQYFKDNNISKYANLRMKVKTAFMILLYFVPLILMISGVIQSFWPMIAMWVLMGFGMSGIGLSIMHDANHGAYSRNKRVNAVLGFLVNFLGGYHENWKIQHNILHHTYTNVHGMDEDIDNAAFRMSPDQERKPFHRFQVLYGPVLYSIMTIYWFTSKDFQGLVRYHKKDLLKAQGLDFNKTLIRLCIYKAGYVFLTLILPMIILPIAWWKVLIGFLVMHIICGLALALIFQPAHVMEATDFFQPDADGSFENSWAIHQLRTTSNFANKSTFFSWFVGGLNFQIEHHLFPNICHIHYKKISKIVKQTAQEFQLPYHQHHTFLDAVWSHFKVLHELGTGKYDRRLAAKS